MRLSTIAAQINLGSVNQLSPDDLAQVMDAAQKAAFQRKLAAFLVYDRKLEVLTALTFAAAGYTEPGPNDIGQVATGETSGATATLVSVDDETREWRVSGAGTFMPGEYVVTDGGSRACLSAQGTWKGPYPPPSGCRKVWGVTTRRPGTFNFRGNDSYSVDGVRYTGDYGMSSGRGSPFEGGQVNDLDNSFLWAYAPSLTGTYWWVFWRLPPDITDFDDESALLIPAAYHVQFVRLCRAAADAILSGEVFDDALVDRFLGGWMDSLRAPYRDQRGYQNMTQDGMV